MVDLEKGGRALPRYFVDPRTGQPAQSETYTLASNQTLAAGSSTTAVTITASASYGWSYVLTGTSPSLKLQALGPDSATWQDIATVTASGQQGLAIFAGNSGAPLRLYNAGSNPITGLSSRLSS